MSSDGRPRSSTGREILPAGSGGLHENPESTPGSSAQPGNLPNLASAGSGGHQGESDGPQGPTLQPPNNGSSIPPAIQTALADCEAIVEQYRGRRVDKSKALLEIYQKLLGTGIGDASSIESSFSSFLKAIEDHDKQENAAAGRGGLIAPPAQRPDGAPVAVGGSGPPPLEQTEGGSSVLDSQYP
jgi:hypothetical protein